MEERKVREEKLKKLQELGYQAYPYRFDVDHTISQVVESYSELSREELEKERIDVRVAGRILTLRRMGKATFFHFSDGRKRLQCFLKQDILGEEKYKHFKYFDIGDWIGVKGYLFRTKTGELTVLVEDFTLLAKCLLPLPEKWHGLQDVELRFRKRYLDLIANPEVRKTFETRAKIIRIIRSFLEERGFIEVETPMMQPIPGGALARPFITHHNALDIDLYLRIAPELYLKRLVVGGMERVYELNRNFRNEGLSPLHNPEFTMLEFYWAYRDYNDLMELTEELFERIALEVWGGLEGEYQGQKISFKRPWKRVKYMEELSARSGIPEEKLWDQEFVIKHAKEIFPEEGVPPSTYGKALDFLFDEYVKPHLISPTFVIDHPKQLSPLAKAHREDPRLVERFELFIAGMEIANAFSELNDPKEQEERFRQQLREREAGDEEAHRIDYDYINALEYGLPPTAGEGIGIDRTVMIFTDRANIREVILFPLLRPRE